MPSCNCCGNKKGVYITDFPDYGKIAICDDCISLWAEETKPTSPEPTQSD